MKTKEREFLKKYYGKVIQSKRDLKTSACCVIDEALHREAREVLPLIHPEIREKFYGCGSPIPPLVEGLTVLDLGCGTGRDVYILSKLVGQEGKVIGVDMTGEQLEVAERHREYHREQFGFDRSNVEFIEGYIEDLGSAGIPDESVDLVVSNCVINLSPDKEKVFREVFRVLRTGGELYFSDIFAGRRVPDDVREDPLLYGECMGGAMYVEDFRRLITKLGYPDFRIVSSRRVEPLTDDLKERVAHVDFYSLTVRVFKLPDLEDRCEDYGQIATYLGTIPGYPNRFDLDREHSFIRGKATPVCGNTASMLSETRFAGHFRVEGDRSLHFGLFACGSGKEEDAPENSPQGCC
ncbi:MAG: methyltransferase domain-containing protein [Deltaproteobacteria bacterium]|nr:MAG: methyltransferase domain-containing protein [Deltaproteobacteria bacterium]